jgi:hypothetical protein
VDRLELGQRQLFFSNVKTKVIILCLFDAKYMLQFTRRHIKSIHSSTHFIPNIFSLFQVSSSVRCCCLLLESEVSQTFFSTKVSCLVHMILVLESPYRVAYMFYVFSSSSVAQTGGNFHACKNCIFLSWALSLFSCVVFPYETSIKVSFMEKLDENKNKLAYDL